MRSTAVLVCGVALCALCAGAVWADPVDLWEDFPDAQGQYHFFALALPWVNTGEGSYVRMDDLGAYSFGTLAEEDWNVPFIKRGELPWIQMHPAAAQSEGKGTGLDYVNAIYTYKVPEAGLFNVEGVFAKGDSGDTYVFVKHNRDFLWSHSFSAADAIGAEASFSLLNEQLNVDDEVYFGVGCGASHEDFGDTTFLRGTITAAPEPVSSVLFLLGAGGLAGARKLRRRIG